MSQAQTRKQKILGDVKRKRRQRTVTSIVIAASLIAIIVVAVIFLRPPPNRVPLPDYLSHCVTLNLFYHSHPNLTIFISGQHIFLPGPTFDSGCPQPLHNHDTSGVIHVETDQDRDYTLKDWFLLWGHFVNDPTFAIFNSTQIFNNRVGPGHNMTMTTDGVTDPLWENHVFPRNASPTGGSGGIGLCAVPTGQTCVRDNIVITYT